MRRRSLACHRTSRASPSTEEENANLFFRSTGRFLVVVVVVVILGNNLEVFLKIFRRVFPNNNWSIAVVRYRGRSDHTEYLKRSIVAAKVYEKSPALSKQLSSHLPWIIQIYKQYCRLCSISTLICWYSGLNAGVDGNAPASTPPVAALSLEEGGVVVMKTSKKSASSQTGNCLQSYLI